ncbi:MAG: toxin-antitoxin system HicB family antitoxin [Candidatus Hydrogenedentes bacterium]|nr:toxin-antitoxin system HicB family antitoxin [Candidatus Hydrogenedentota bacterium]
MSTISVRLPDSLHAAVRELARQENTSINHLITLALAEKISALMTEEYITPRAKRASKRKFRAALKKVADFEPEPWDRL